MGRPLKKKIISENTGLTVIIKLDGDVTYGKIIHQKSTKMFIILHQNGKTKAKLVNKTEEELENNEFILVSMLSGETFNTTKLFNRTVVIVQEDKLKQYPCRYQYGMPYIENQ